MDDVRPQPRDGPGDLPAYLPARMLNEFVYCPRLFYYEWVEGVFDENPETVEGKIRHSTVDGKEEPLARPDEALESAELSRSRSVMLSSDTYGLIARLDVIELRSGVATPVDYKRGAPMATDKGPRAWDADQAQIVAQALILRDNGYDCSEGIVYYAQTKQRVRVAIDDALVDSTIEALAGARATGASPEIPPPLVDSPKCPRCSLVGICLPDETTFLAGMTISECSQSPSTEAQATTPGQPKGVRRLVAARDDLRPLYLNTQGLHVGKSGGLLKVTSKCKEKNKVVDTFRINEISQLNVFGNVQISTQAIQTLLQADVPIAYFSQGGWHYGTTHGLGEKNVFLRRAQFRKADDPEFCLDFSRRLVHGKIRNARVMLQRNHVEPPRRPLDQLRGLATDAERAETIDTLLGIEGNAARVYFGAFSGMIKAVDDEGFEHAPDLESQSEVFRFDFTHRTKRPPRDAVNALLSLAYSVLAKDLAIVCHNVGFDPFLGFFHKPRFGRQSLALDLMEPFRPLIADSTVLTAINTRMVDRSDFIRTGTAVALKAKGRKSFFRAYEQRMDSLVTHPLLGYRVSYRRLLEIQTRLLARVLTGEIGAYPVFTTR